MRFDHQRAPLYEAMIDYTEKVRGNFHVPGHKQGNAFDWRGKEYFSSLLSLDLTEIAELDDLHDATGVIAEAQQLAAEAFGAEDTFFLVGGTTAGNLASLLAVCRPEESVIIQRSSHQSIFHGCMLAGVKPIYVSSEIDLETGLEKPINPKQIDHILRNNIKVKGVWMTSPSYFGVNQPIREISSICHRFGIPLIVDEAHGAHYTFHDRLPLSAMESGADIAIQSTHKMLPSMTMSSMMHLQGKRIKKGELEHWLRVIQSSSPSYPLMASLDLARRYMVNEGKVQLDRVWRRLDGLRQFIEQKSFFKELRLDQHQDPFKMSLCFKGETGFSLSSFFKARGIFPELADRQKVLFLFSLGSTMDQLDLLKKEMEQMKAKELIFSDDHDKMFSISPRQPVSEAQCSFDEIKRTKKRKVPIYQAVGRLAVDMITPYPPGIPAVLPGEIFTKEIVEELIGFIDEGGRVRGIGRDQLKQVNVLE